MKLQILNLGSKLYFTNPNQTSGFFRHILNLSKWDSNYDVRDRERLMRGILFSNNNTLKERGKSLFLLSKPTPVEISHFEG